MNRRNFLGALGVAAGSLMLPELIKPARTIFLPPTGGWPTEIAHGIIIGKRSRALPVDYGIFIEGDRALAIAPGISWYIDDYAVGDTFCVGLDNSGCVEYTKNGQSLIRLNIDEIRETHAMFPPEKRA